MSDQDRMINQRPSENQNNQNNQERGLTRSDNSGLSAYGGYGSLSSPFELMRRFTEDVDRLFGGFGGFGFSGFPFDTGRTTMQQGTRAGGSTGMTGMTTWAPSVDVFTRENDLVVAAELTGMKPEDVDVHVEGNNLVIQGQTHTETENRDQDRNYWYTERRFGSFYRTIPLPQGVNPDNAKANFNNGMLEITFPEAARNLQPQRRRIEIQGAGNQQSNTGSQPKSETQPQQG